VAELRALIPAAPAAEWWDTPDIQHVVYRMLLGTPFSAFDVRLIHPSLAVARPVAERRSDDPTLTDPGPTPDPEMPVSVALGRIFDAVVLPNARLRGFANAWTRWSIRYLIELAGVHRCRHSVNGGTWGSNDRQVPCPLCRKARSTVLGASVPDLTGTFDTSAGAGAAAPAL
jgi:hypothetical protein